jgi:hypothetical protein
MGRASFLFPDFETSPGTENIRVRIADWSSGYKLPMKRKRHQKKTKIAF